MSAINERPVNETTPVYGQVPKYDDAWGIFPYSEKLDITLFAMQFIPVLNIVPGTILAFTAIAANHRTEEDRAFKTSTSIKAALVLSGLQPLFWWAKDGPVTYKRFKATSES